MSSYRTEFPRYEVPQVIQDLVNSGWLIDTSWHNDAMPSFEHEVWPARERTTPEDEDDDGVRSSLYSEEGIAYSVRVWVDCENQADSDMNGFPDWRRFGLVLDVFDAEGGLIDIDGLKPDVLITTNDAVEAVACLKQDFTVRVLAREFSRLLAADLDVDERRAVIEKNKELAKSDDPLLKGCCASHDYVDANQYMLDAWEHLYGRPIHMSFAGDPTTEADVIADQDIVDPAWDLAKANGFWFDFPAPNNKTRPEPWK